jgi:hypothetical protein
MAILILEDTPTILIYNTPTGRHTHLTSSVLWLKNVVPENRGVEVSNLVEYIHCCGDHNGVLIHLRVEWREGGREGRRLNKTKRYSRFGWNFWFCVLDQHTVREKHLHSKLSKPIHSNRRSINLLY